MSYINSYRQNVPLKQHLNDNMTCKLSLVTNEGVEESRTADTELPAQTLLNCKYSRTGAYNHDGFALNHIFLSWFINNTDDAKWNGRWPK